MSESGRFLALLRNSASQRVDETISGKTNETVGTSDADRDRWHQTNDVDSKTTPSEKLDGRTE